MKNRLCKLKKYNNGFTLAEVLITLVIVGVIAAMTIPTVINNTKKQEFVSKLKKTYSSLSTITNKIISEDGLPRADIGGWASSSENIYNLYKKHLSIAKDCGQNAGCFAQLKVSGQGYKFLGKFGGKAYDTDNWNTNTNLRKLILSDGVQIAFVYSSSDCSAAGNGEIDFCGKIYVDINGEKNPNQVGRDVFLFSIKENGLYPFGCPDMQECLNTNVSGVSCACRVLGEGAMNY